MWCWRLLRVPLTARRSNQSVLGDHSWIFFWKDWCWSWSSSILATGSKEPTHWKRPWSWERLMARGEGDDRGWDGWMASPTQWTRVWASFESWWWTRKPGMLQSMGIASSRTWLSDLAELNSFFLLQSVLSFWDFVCWFVLIVMDREVSCAAVLGIAKTQTQLSNWTMTTPFKVLRLRTK